MGNIKNTIIRNANMFAFKINKNKDKIYLTLGVTGFIGGAVLVGIASTKLNSILEDANEKIDKIKSIEEDEELSKKYTDAEFKKSYINVYANTVWDVTKLYLPSVLLISAATYCTCRSYHIMNGKVIALASGLAAMESKNDDIIKNIAERFGKNVADEISNPTIVETVEEKILKDSGEEEIVEKKVTKSKVNELFTYIFDELNPNFFKDPLQNKFFLENILNWAIDKCKRNGYLYLNDVLVALGYKPIGLGCVYGWTYDPKRDGDRPNISFNLDSLHNLDFKRGLENAAILRFNCKNIVNDFDKCVVY